MEWKKETGKRTDYVAIENDGVLIGAFSQPETTTDHAMLIPTEAFLEGQGQDEIRQIFGEEVLQEVLKELS